MKLSESIYTTINRLRHRYGFGVHSPFAYQLVRDVIYEKTPYYAFKELQRERNRKREHLPHYPIQRDELLFRLVNRFQPKVIVEVGTGSGWSMRYMAAAKKAARYATFDTKANKEAEEPLKRCAATYQANNEKTETCLMEFSTIDLLHIAHTEAYEAVMEEALNHVSPRTLIIISGIDESETKRKWWQRVVEDPRTGFTFDLRHTGLVFFDNAKPKQHYLI